MEGYFKYQKTLSEIAVEEGTGGKHYGSLVLSIGRGRIAIFRSMLRHPGGLQRELISELQELLREKSGEGLTPLGEYSEDNSGVG